MMAKQQMVAPKADQPRASTEQLKRGEQMPSLTYRQTGYKTYGTRTDRRSSGRS